MKIKLCNYHRLFTILVLAPFACNTLRAQADFAPTVLAAGRIISSTGTGFDSVDGSYVDNVTITLTSATTFTDGTYTGTYTYTKTDATHATRTYHIVQGLYTENGTQIGAFTSVTGGTYSTSGSWSYNGTNATFTSSGTFTLSADVTQPVSTLTAPTSGQRWSNSVFTVTGTATDDAQVANVRIQLNNTGWQSAFTANHWANWTATNNLILGTNLLQAYAVDTSGNVSITNNVSFQYVDVTPPTNTITAPTSGQRWSNSIFTVTGTATDNAQVASVWIQLNNTGWQNASSANQWANWTATPNLIPGTNFLQAYAVDTSGNVSLINSVSFQYVVTNQLQVRALGLGTCLLYTSPSPRD